ncbi:MAG: S1 domain-containing RNA-binding protein [Phascolarctobacterium sp.]|nr:S1 domain-containing RNA-binding protein [Phascolarctobacterium sp.]
MSLEVGAIVEGEVTGITNFGAFVQLPEGKVGLIHISEVSNVYVKDVHDFLKEHDKVKVKVLSVDERGKIGLSIKQLTPPPAAAPQQPKPQRPQNENRERRVGMRPQNARPASPVSFEDKLSKFLKDSDDRMLDLKRNTESKRGGRGARRER